MAGRLIRAAAGGARRHRAALAALSAAVLALHWGALSDLGDRLGGFAPADAMPPRIAVAYLRELEPTAPPAPPATPPAVPRRMAVPRAPRPAASAPRVAEPPPPAEPANDPAADVPAAAAAAETPPQPAAEPEPPATAASAAAEAIAVAPAASIPELPAVADAASAPAFSWPGSTRLSYRLNGYVRGEINGSAQVEWVRAGTRYQVHLDVTVGLPIAPMITRRMSSDGELTDAGLVPQRYDEDTKVMFRDPRRVTMFFEPDAVVLPNGDRRPRPPDVQDSASQFVQLAWIFTLRPELLRQGNSIEIPLALPRNVSTWVYEVIGEDTVNTPFGAVETHHLKPRRPGRSGDLSAEMWIAPTLRYLPVRIRIRQDDSTYIDMLIARRPEIAEPER